MSYAERFGFCGSYRFYLLFFCKERYFIVKGILDNSLNNPNQELAKLVARIVTFGGKARFAFAI